MLFRRCSRSQQVWTVSSAIDILSSIDTSSMDEATAAAVNSAVQSAIGNFRWCGYCTGRCGKSGSTCRSVSGLNEQAAVQEAAGAASYRVNRLLQLVMPQHSFRAVYSRLKAVLQTLNADDTQKQNDEQTAANLATIKAKLDKTMMVLPR